MNERDDKPKHMREAPSPPRSTETTQPRKDHQPQHMRADAPSPPRSTETTQPRKDHEPQHTRGERQATDGGTEDRGTRTAAAVRDARSRRLDNAVSARAGGTEAPSPPRHHEARPANAETTKPTADGTGQERPARPGRPGHEDPHGQGPLISEKASRLPSGEHGQTPQIRVEDPGKDLGNLALNNSGKIAGISYGGLRKLGKTHGVDLPEGTGIGDFVQVTADWAKVRRDLHKAGQEDDPLIR